MDRIDDLLLQHPAAPARTRRRLSVGFARTPQSLRAAQALRWRVFAEELGARLSSREAGIDQDLFDAHCEHLIVRDEDSGEVVGTYRILPPEAARRVGCYYAESEFDLTRLRLLRARMVEAGRSCIHPDYRNGAVITLLWAGLARYMQAHGHQYLAGCASMGMADGGHAAASVYARLSERHMAPIEYRVFPRWPLPLERLDANAGGALPALVQGYLRAGAWVCGEPAWDPDFSTADFFLLLPIANLAPRYARHYLRKASRV
ncbi:MAG TPA: GNAT family N-acyltransferase [Burkholderiales bacterium]|nr:GNAT family N-acyltransferase [Burkholderiales bacterium]